MAHPSKRLLALMDKDERKAMIKDRRMDKKRGIKEGSPRDERIDARVKKEAIAKAKKQYEERRKKLTKWAVDKKDGALKSDPKNMRTHGKTAGKEIKTSVRKKTATIVQHKAGPDGGTTRYRFPMPDKAHDRNALARLPDAKDLSATDRAKIKARAQKLLGEN